MVLAAIAAALSITTDGADARYHRRFHHHHSSGEGYSPPTASIIVDGNTGAVLEESNPDAPRHPASLTKVMTLYLLFERLDAGKIKLDTPLTVSAHAAAQSPTKLGLESGDTISVESAIKGIVTRSANDAAVVIAENLGGSEEAFARLMTQKARALGMSHTTYTNASGLPDDDQVTTARDQALLGRAIQDRFPHYYRYFSTTSFVFRGETIRGHNHLLGSVPGVDGIKTGFTDASGFNLLTSVHRDGRYIVGVVLGGRSASERDAHMRDLISANIKLAAARGAAPIVADLAQPKAEPRAAFGEVLAKKATPQRADPTLTASTNPRVVVGSSDPIKPVVVKTLSYRTVTVRRQAMQPMPVLVPVTQPALPVVAAQPASNPQTRPLPTQPPPAVVASAPPTFAANPPPPKAEPAPQAAKPATFRLASADPAPAAPVAPAAPAAAHPHSGWVIQIGAYGGEDEARQHLNEAQLKLHAMLASADPFTEAVQKGDTTLYRARFAGFDKATAEAACRQLKRSDFACMALKD